MHYGNKRSEEICVGRYSREGERRKAEMLWTRRDEGGKVEDNIELKPVFHYRFFSRLFSFVGTEFADMI